MYTQVNLRLCGLKRVSSQAWGGRYFGIPRQEVAPAVRLRLRDVERLILVDH